MSEKTFSASGYTCRSIQNRGLGTPIVFLHGLSYTAEIWQTIGATAFLAQKQVPFLALDMPYGLRSHCEPKTRSNEKNVNFAQAAVKDSFGSEVPVLVGASIGGHMALLYAAQFPVKGLLLVAPARPFEKGMAESYADFRFPVRVVWGTKDNIVSGEDMRLLAQKLPNATLVMYEGAQHSAYKEQPGRFNRDLMELYEVAK
jgi:pimeloyl-ACP methyl ester carboxylesterase